MATPISFGASQRPMYFELHSIKTETTIHVAWLSGTKQLAMTGLSIESFRTCCREPFNAWVLSDGSLSEEACRNSLGGEVNFVHPADLATAREGVLRGRPGLTWHYKASPLAKKIIDIPQLFDGPFLFCDSDVLFFDSFTVASVVEGRWRFVYMLDSMNGYSMHWRNRRLRRREVPLVHKCNTGLIFLRSKNWIDYDHANSLATNPDCSWHLPHLEQTQWASLAARNIDSSGYWSPSQVAFPRRTTNASTLGDGGVVALHYAGPLRDLMPCQAPLAPAASEAASELLVEPARPYQFSTDLGAGVLRVAKRIGRKFWGR